jgi:hypothetical protein
MRRRRRSVRLADRRCRARSRRGGIALLAIILVSSIVLAEPINEVFRRLPEGIVPPDADRLRRRWRRFHLLRTALAVSAFTLFVNAVASV